MASWQTGGFFVVRNTTSGFIRSNQFGSGYLDSLDTGDVDGDGRTDVVTRNGDSVVVFLQWSPLTFATGITLAVSENGASVSAMAVADLTGVAPRPTVNVFRYRGWGSDQITFRFAKDGTFTQEVTQLGGLITAFLMADINGDGRADQLLFDGDETLLVMLQGTAGVFTAAGRYGRVKATLGLGGLVADVNGDGRPDLLSAGAVSYGNPAGWRAPGWSG